MQLIFRTFLVVVRSGSVFILGLSLSSLEVRRRSRAQSDRPQARQKVCRACSTAWRCKSSTNQKLVAAAAAMPVPKAVGGLSHDALSHQTVGRKGEERIRERSGMRKRPLIANVWRNPGDVREVGAVEP